MPVYCDASVIETALNGSSLAQRAWCLARLFQNGMAWILTESTLMNVHFLARTPLEKRICLLWFNRPTSIHLSQPANLVRMAAAITWASANYKRYICMTDAMQVASAILGEATHFYTVRPLPPDVEFALQAFHIPIVSCPY